MEAPSKELLQQLHALGLGAADLRRCHRLVKKLARGLPLTESLWIDALAVSGKLSQFQAKAIETGRSEDLQIGQKFILKTPLQLEPKLSCFEGSLAGKRAPVLISRIPCSTAEKDPASLRILKTIKSLSSARESIPAVPFDAVFERQHLFLLAPFLAGESLEKLLVRRGRFPESVVRSIAMEVSRQLQAAGPAATHGDLRPANVWLTKRGEIHLLNWGLLDAVTPHVSIHSQFPLDTYNGIAPERMESGQAATPLSEIYALGCLLWQLLAGRPPFPVADPLGKLNAHLARPVPDVRTLAPMVSESLAGLIKGMTAREPHRRPQHFNEVRTQLVSATRGNRARLHRFVSQFESAAPRQIGTEKKSRSKAPALAAATLLSVGLGLLAWNRDSFGWPGLTRVSASVSESSTIKTAFAPASTAGTSLPQVKEAQPGSLQPSLPVTSFETGEEEPIGRQLPSPSSDGLVQLEAGQEYIAGELVAGETLILRGDPAFPPTIRIDREPLTLEADQLRLENVRIILGEKFNDQPATTAIQLRTQTVSLIRCSVSAADTEESNPLISWTSPTGLQSVSGRMLIQDSVLETSRDLFQLEIPFGAALFENVLKLGSGSLLNLQKGIGTGLRAPLILNRCTLRGTGPVISLTGQDALAHSGQISLQGKESVIDLKQGAPVISLSQPNVDNWQSYVEVAAQGVIVEVGVRLAGVRMPNGSGYTEIPSDEVSVDGLLSGDFHFEPGKLEEREFPQLVIDALPIRMSDQLPGIDPHRLPRP